MNLLKILFEMASRKNDLVLKGSKCHQTCCSWTSTLWWWKEICDVECWRLRRTLCEYSSFLPNRCLEIVFL